LDDDDERGLSTADATHPGHSARWLRRAPYRLPRGRLLARLRSVLRARDHGGACWRGHGSRGPAAAAARRDGRSGPAAAPSHGDRRGGEAGSGAEGEGRGPMSYDAAYLDRIAEHL